MATMKVTGPLSWFKAQTFVGNREARTIGHNTTVHEITYGDVREFSVRLHGNEIIRIHRDGTYTLKDGGWQTVTTKQRLNALGPVPVWQTKFQWYVGGPNPEGTEFYSGIRVDRYGRVVE